MLKEIENEETKGFVVTFLPLVTFQLGGRRGLGPRCYAYGNYYIIMYSL